MSLSNRQLTPTYVLQIDVLLEMFIIPYPRCMSYVLQVILLAV